MGWISFFNSKWNYSKITSIISPCKTAEFGPTCIKRQSNNQLLTVFNASLTRCLFRGTFRGTIVKTHWRQAVLQQWCYIGRLLWWGCLLSSPQHPRNSVPVWPLISTYVHGSDPCNASNNTCRRRRGHWIWECVFQLHILSKPGSDVTLRYFSQDLCTFLRTKGEVGLALKLHVQITVNERKGREGLRTGEQ